VSTKALPINLTIPAIDINTNIKSVGITKTGEMEVPDNIIDVGWYKFGPYPGENGSAVIDGHFDGKNGEPGVFADLYKLKVGDKLYVKDDKGTTNNFVVREKRIYDPGQANDVFSPSSSSHLNLITCDGLWDGIKKSYNKRLVIFTDKEEN
jgi:LPXTG-site transpeptidase (sortase) family protein